MGKTEADALARATALAAGFEAMAPPTALLDGDGRVLDCNAAWRALLPASAQAGARGQMAAHAMTQMAGEPFVFETGAILRSPARPGQAFRLATAEAGAFLVATLVEVTGEIKALEELRFSYRIRDQLLHDAQVGTWRYDPDADLYHFSSELSLGYERASEPVPTALLRSLQHPKDAPVDEAIRQRITRDGGEGVGEMRYRGGDGSWSHLHVHYRAGRRMPSGLYEMFGISQDVTALAHVRDEARVAAQRLRLALTAAHAGAYEYRFREGATWLSPELMAMLSPEALDEARTAPLKAFHPDDVAQLGKPVEDESGEIPPVDLRLRHRDGLRWARLYVELERYPDGSFKRGVGLVLDIHEQKLQADALDEARRAAESATRTKSQFLASVSHEIRTPMNGVVGVLNLLQREALSDQGRQLLGEALACSDMLAQLINDVLDFSKIEAGKLELAPAPTDPLTVAMGVINLLRPQADAKRLLLDIRTPDVAGHVAIDPMRLRQCLFNVIGNAVKFTERGRVEVRLSFVGAGAGQKLRFEVQDTGVGVPEAARDSLFGMFQQAESGTTRKFGGTGLGLAITRQLARQMGGDIDFNSIQGHGSTFWLEFAAPPAAAPSGAVQDAFAGDPLAGLKILVVDDNATNRLVCAKTLEAMGAQAVTVDSGFAAIEAVQATAFDLVLMDVNMPQMDGLEATRRIRALPGSVGQLPIVALTADSMSHHLDAYAEAGMDGMAPKPFSPAQLLSVILDLQAPATAADGAEAFG